MVLKPVNNLLFLARFAPEQPECDPKDDPEWGNSPKYHHRLYHALAATGANVICPRTPSQLLGLKDKVDYVYSIYNRASFRNSEIFVPRGWRPQRAPERSLFAFQPGRMPTKAPIRMVTITAIPMANASGGAIGLASPGASTEAYIGTMIRR